MSLFDVPFLAKLAGAIDKKKPIQVYSNQETIVTPANAEEIDVRPYDMMTIEVSGNGMDNGEANLRVSGYGGVQAEFLDIYEYQTRKKMTYYGTAPTYASGIRAAGKYIVSLTGINSIRIPIYAKAAGGISLRINLAQSFGGFTAESPVIVSKSQHDQIVYSNSNKHRAYTMLGPNINQTEFFEPRTGGERYLERIAHADFGVFEQTLFLFNNTDATMTNVRLAGDFTESRNPNRDLITNPFIAIPEIAPGKAILFASDKSIETAQTGQRADIYIVCELRLPFWAFRMSYVMSSPATTGNVYLQSVRRF